MSKIGTVGSGVKLKSRSHVARDPYPVTAGVQKAVSKRLKTARRETARIKAKRQAA